MNNAECNVVRDLMPLCIDSAASEDSRKLVVDHVWKCEKCAQVYQEMQGHLLPGQQDDIDYLDIAARKQQRKRRNRKRILIALTCMLTAVVVLLAVWGYGYATQMSIFPVGLDEYDVYLTRTREDGRIILNINMDDKRLCYSYSIVGTREKNGDCFYSISVETTLIRKHWETPQRVNTDVEDGWYWSDGAVYSGYTATHTPIASIRVVCGDEEKVIYQLGDDIPYCSEELEAYYKACDAYDDYDTSENRRSYDFLEKMEELRQKTIELVELVPEWQ